MIANGSALLRYLMIISVKKLTQVIKSNRSVFLRIQQRNLNILTGTTCGKSKKIHCDTSAGGHFVSSFKYSRYDFP